jgi:hypothetical protein
LIEFGLQQAKFSSIFAMFYYRMVRDDVWDECLIFLYWYYVQILQKFLCSWRSRTYGAKFGHLDA